MDYQNEVMYIGTIKVVLTTHGLTERVIDTFNEELAKVILKHAAEEQEKEVVA